MSSMIQFSLEKKREKQWAQFMMKRPDLQELGQTDAVKKILFDTMDAAVPLPQEDGDSK